MTDVGLENTGSPARCGWPIGPRLLLERRMGAVFLSEENVHGESHLLPFNLKEIHDIGYTGMGHLSSRRVIIYPILQWH